MAEPGPVALITDVLADPQARSPEFGWANALDLPFRVAIKTGTSADFRDNLAVAYITQQPPLVELARWHYQKALAAGHPRNPELEKMLDAKQPASSGQ